MQLGKESPTGTLVQEVRSLLKVEDSFSQLLGSSNPPACAVGFCPHTSRF